MVSEEFSKERVFINKEPNFTKEKKITREMKNISLNRDQNKIINMKPDHQQRRKKSNAVAN